MRSLRGRSVLVAIIFAATLVAVPSAASAASAATGTAVTLYGRGGSFGDLGGFAGQTPSGQKLTKTAVSSWDVPGGQMPFFTKVTADGTVFSGGFNLNGNNFLPTDDETVILAFDPTAGTYRNVRIPSDTGRFSARLPNGSPAGAAISDVEPVAGGNALAYVATAPFQDPGGSGVWPTFGILTKTGGTWRPVPANQSTARRLHDSNPALGPQACPADTTGQAFCRGLNELARLPASHDIIVTQYSGGAGAPNGGLLALRVTGPDAQGRFDTAIRGFFPFPEMENPQTPDDDELNFSSREVQVDPTGTRGNERFTVGFDVWNAHSALMEFRYDADSGTITPTSPPFFPSGRNGSDFWGGGATLYDHQGNLWVRRAAGFRNGDLAVYANVNGRRRVGGPECPLVPGKGMDEYSTTSGGKTVWGVECPPDYDLLQPREPVATMGLVQNPVNHDVVALGNGGTLTAIRTSGSGRDMTFRIGSLVDSGYPALPFQTTPSNGIVNSPPGGFDSAGRFWFWIGQVVHPSCEIQIPPPDPVPPCMTDNREVRADHWLVSIDVPQLFAPPPVLAPNVSGWWAEIQAGYTTTTATVARPPDAEGTIAVDSVAYMKNCGGGCEDDGIPGSGFMLADDTGFGHLTGNTVEYQVNAPTAGSYDLRLRAASFAGFTGRIAVEIAGVAHTLTVDTGGAWQTVVDPTPVNLPAGVSTIRVSAPDGGGGVWFLSFFILIRR